MTAIDAIGKPPESVSRVSNAFYKRTVKENCF